MTSEINESKVSIKIVYIDDRVDEGVSEYLSEIYTSQPYHDAVTQRIAIKDYKEIPFKKDATYEKLLSNSDVREANIIIIDNYLFEERNARDKFTGKQFKLILQEVFPFIQTLVITQDQNLEGRNVVHKYDSLKSDIESKQYYKNELEKRLDDAISGVLEYRDESKKLAQNIKADGNLLFERIDNSLKGINAYEALTKQDIDTLVKAFKELKENVNKKD